MNKIKHYYGFIKTKILTFYDSRIRPMPTWARGILWAIFSIFLFLFLFYFFVRIGVFGHIPSNNELRAINNPLASEVYDEEGKLFGKYYIENRTNASFDDIAPSVIQALISTEDERFYSHNGVDIESWGRVLFKTILSQEKGSGGGSTISQQLAKNLYDRQNYWIFSMPINKMREIVIARKLEDVFSKEEILTLYLNTVSFGGDAYGIRVASRKIFSATPKELTIGESATLIGMLKATTAYNPLKNTQRATERRNIVLKRMLSNGFITDSTYQRTIKEPLLVNHTIDPSSLGIAQYFREHLKTEIDEVLKNVKKSDGSSYNIFTDGLKIYTSIDQKMQLDAEKTVKEHLSYLQTEFDRVWAGKDPWPDENYLMEQMLKTERYQKMKSAGASDETILQSFNTKSNIKLYDVKKDSIVDVVISPLDSLKHYCKMLRSGLLCVDNKTGLVKAWVGGYDYNSNKFDHVKAVRQVGSTFKPIVFAQAIRIGMDPCKFYPNIVKTYPEWDNWKPENVDHSQGGSNNMPQTLAKSINVITAAIGMEAGLSEIATLASEMGIRQKILAVPSLSLGSVDGNLLDLCRVYGTIANRGKSFEIQCIKRIEDKNGKVLFDYEVEKKMPKQVLLEDVADLLIKMLEKVVNNGTGSAIRSVYRLEGEIAGKTGTSQENADGWFIGFTPSFLTGVWVGAESPVIKFKYGNLGQGANAALPIWAKFNHKIKLITKIATKIKDEKFAEPSDSLKNNYACIFSNYYYNNQDVPDSLGFSTDTMRVFSNPILDEMRAQKLKDSLQKRLN